MSFSFMNEMENTADSNLKDEADEDSGHVAVEGTDPPVQNAEGFCATGPIECNLKDLLKNYFDPQKKEAKKSLPARRSAYYEHKLNLLFESLDSVLAEEGPSSTDPLKFSFDETISVITRHIETFIIMRRYRPYETIPSIFSGQRFVLNNRTGIYTFRLPFTSEKVLQSRKDFIYTRHFIGALLFYINLSIESLRECSLPESIAYAEIAFDLLEKNCLPDETTKHLLFVTRMIGAYSCYYINLLGHATPCACENGYESVIKKNKEKVSKILSIKTSYCVELNPEDGEKTEESLNLHRFVSKCINHPGISKYSTYCRWVFTWAITLTKRRRVDEIQKRLKMKLAKLEEHEEELERLVDEIKSNSANLLVDGPAGWIKLHTMECIRIYGFFMMFVNAERRFNLQSKCINLLREYSMTDEFSVRLQDFICMHLANSTKIYTFIPRLLEKPVDEDFARRYLNSTTTLMDKFIFGHAKQLRFYRLVAIDAACHLYFSRFLKDCLRNNEAMETLRLKQKCKAEETSLQLLKRKEDLDATLQFFVESMQNKTRYTNLTIGVLPKDKLAEKCNRLLFCYTFLQIHLKDTSDESVEMKATGSNETSEVNDTVNKKESKNKGKSRKSKKSKPDLKFNSKDSRNKTSDSVEIEDSVENKSGQGVSSNTKPDAENTGESLEDSVPDKSSLIEVKAVDVTEDANNAEFLVSASLPIERKDEYDANEHGAVEKVSSTVEECESLLKGTAIEKTQTEERPEASVVEKSESFYGITFGNFGSRIQSGDDYAKIEYSAMVLESVSDNEIPSSVNLAEPEIGDEFVLDVKSTIVNVNEDGNTIVNMIRNGVLELEFPVDYHNEFVEALFKQFMALFICLKKSPISDEPGPLEKIKNVEDVVRFLQGYLKEKQTREKVLIMLKSIHSMLGIALPKRPVSKSTE